MGNCVVTPEELSALILERDVLRAKFLDWQELANIRSVEIQRLRAELELVMSSLTRISHAIAAALSPPD